jgi:uncharacterized membrane protein
LIIVLIILGAVLGGTVLGGFFGGTVTGALLGLLAGWAFKQSQQLDALQNSLTSLKESMNRVERIVDRVDRKKPSRKPESPPEPAKAAPPEAKVEPKATPEPEKPHPVKPLPPPAGVPPSSEPSPEFESPGTFIPPRRAPKAMQTPAYEQPGPDIAEVAARSIKRWFTTGNVPVKVGMIVSLFGVAFLIKEGVDRGWIAFPIELRLILVALFGIALLIIGWRLRDKRRVYALTVQGGGIATIYLTAFAAFRLYSLLPPLPALVMLVIVTLAAGTLAVLQNSRTLALLGIVGGFVAPVLVSSGAGSHVVLFSYYAVLNAAVFGISWFKAWRILNVLGFLFTFVIGTIWGYLAYSPEHFATTEPFLVVFVLMYTLIPVSFASQKATDFQGYVDGTLVFGTPLVGFGLQSQLVGHTEYGLAISAVVLAALYVSIATYLFKHKARELRVMTESFWGLSVVFLVIAVPLALNARWVSVAWALQGAGMVWLGMRQDRTLALGAGILLQLGAAAAYILQPDVGRGDIAIVNGYYLGALLIAVAGWFSSWVFEHIATERQRDHELILTWLLLAWGTYWWLDAGLREIFRFLPENLALSASLIFVAGTVWPALAAARKLDWAKLRSLGLLIVPAMSVAAVLSFSRQSHPLADYGWLAWPAALATHYGFLRLHESQFELLKVALHAAGYWFLTGILLAEAYWWLDLWTTGVWALSGMLALAAMLILVSMSARTYLSWPVGENWQTYHGVCAGFVLALLALATFILNILSPGNPMPLPYIPVINPLELASIFVILVAYSWYLAAQQYARAPTLDGREFMAVPIILGLFLLTMTVARAVHHWTGVPFDVISLTRSNVLQASLSIVWGSTALAGMVAGARKASRLVWMAGASLMAVVVIKLFVVELGNTGTVTRIISFLGVGIFLLIVGYLAPVPPRDGDQPAAT